jgi:hypothetical protein
LRLPFRKILKLDGEVIETHLPAGRYAVISHKGRVKPLAKKFTGYIEIGYPSLAKNWEICLAYFVTTILIMKWLKQN